MNPTEVNTIAATKDKIYFLKLLYKTKLDRIENDLESNANLTENEIRANNFEREFIKKLLIEIDTI